MTHTAIGRPWSIFFDIGPKLSKLCVALEGFSSKISNREGVAFINLAYEGVAFINLAREGVAFSW